MRFSCLARMHMTVETSRTLHAVARGPDATDGRTILVLDADARHSMAAIRGLSRAGWRVVVAGYDRPWLEPAARSRHTAGYERIPNPFGPAAPFAAALEEIVARRRVTAILACYDGTIARLQSIDPPVPTSPVLGAALDSLSDKLALEEVCRRAGVLYPPTFPVTSLPTPTVEDPVVIKPRRTAIPRPDRVISRTGAFVTSDLAALRTAVATIEGMGLEAIGQRRVDRTRKINVSVLRHAGTTTFRIAYRVLLEYPVSGGLAAMTESIPAEQGLGREAIRAAERVADAAGYEGMANVEFYVQRDGTLCLIEVNPRVWGSLALPEALGLEPTARAIEQVLGQPPRPPLPYRSGRRFHRPSLELRWLLSPSGERGPRSRLFRKLRPGDVVDVFEVRDPLPAITLVLRIAVIRAQVGARSLTRVRRGRR
jgi:ATP-grasp in the biosynthetic pathway with Ter operon